MTGNYYINGIGIISPQRTWLNNEFLAEITEYHHNVLTCVVPDFKEYFTPMQLRRLSRMLRIGASAAMICVKDGGNAPVHNLITATGYGFLRDTARFLNEMLEQQEEDVTPTFFMQSTYNALAGLVALTFKSQGYNSNHVSRGWAFEAALHDAMMQLDKKETDHFLIGAYDEADDTMYKINSRAGHYKKEHISNSKLFDQPSGGTIQGEGAAFFLLSNQPTEQSWCLTERCEDDL
jgi:3-oxoacyl-(acyl-carrier-protein) synthase